jgi:cardiolipin synthase (CMP-forming)
MLQLQRGLPWSKCLRITTSHYTTKLKYSIAFRRVFSSNIPPLRAPQPESASNPDAAPNPDNDAHPDVRWTVPNAMTALRLVLGPVSSGLIISGNMPAAFGVLCFAGFLDWADGAWARAFNAQSLLGSFLDPLADKVRY